MTRKRRNPRRVAAEIIARWEHSGEKIDSLRDEILGGEEGWDPRDRALVTELAYGVVRHLGELDGRLAELVSADLAKMQHRLLAILRVGLYQLLHLERVPVHAAVNEAVAHARALFGEGAAGLANAVLRRAATEQGFRFTDAFYAGKGLLHQWRSKWVEQWGEEKADAWIRFLSRIPPVGLRRNLLRTGDDASWAAHLREEGVSGEPHPGWPGYLYARGVKPAVLPSFQQGLTTAQDPAAGIAPAALDPQPGDAVLDLCCAPGGKTAVLWERMAAEGRLLAVDKSLKRNRLTREGLERLGHEGVEVETADLMSWSPQERFDRVLIDVPCSGTGVAHRRPDLLARRSPLDVPHLGKLQRSLLNRAAEWVKPGGVLVYSTCSLEPEENETRAGEFDKRSGGEFRRDELPETIPAAWRRGVGEAATWPPEHGVDGVYVVRWRRSA
ncbi:MAG TPA: 16S rRNA (cytosine(967)-C(5))-methyltransferase [Bacteroidetes bacterium]|nr:16S rRNA (cytosine(967)-C(5))-methyltransferase [Bacteroidota bacterium]